MSSTPSPFAPFSRSLASAPGQIGAADLPFGPPGHAARAAFTSSPSRSRWAFETDSASAPIICFCHLSWNWVWQRPQQFLSRFARRHPVLFVETYCTETPHAFVRLSQPENAPGVTVLETHLPAARWNDGAFIDAERRRLVRATLREQLSGQFDDPILWFYDPMAVTAFAGRLHERAIVYDCMDELSQFRGAPAELVSRERQLLQCADVVFCGGRKMREKRLPFNANTHFFGTGVDCDHFGNARAEATAIAPEIAALPQPVLGYFGVVDERIDYDLLAQLADANPHWSVVMVGPTAKVDPVEFPRRSNLHWLGGRPYAQLPAITKGFAVCLMPFALNAATEYINPTKALEYMAAGKPVVSTALDEVKSNFGSVARIADDAEEFVALCRRETRAPSRSRIARGLRLASSHTWEAIVAQMEQLIENAVAVRQNGTSSSRRDADISLPQTSAAYV